MHQPLRFPGIGYDGPTDVVVALFTFSNEEGSFLCCRGSLGRRGEKLDITVSRTQVRSDGEQLSELSKLLETGAIKVAIDSVFPLAKARQAHEHAAHGHIKGKIALEVL